ncbi:hypothetical protein [Amycolatopsis sp. lyj-109]|uniref:hypothetical protein n=1 Tax=Amycolatopsis sp. lyj-109 TaxID=2789287 RepID=UPI003979A57B
MENFIPGGNGFPEDPRGAFTPDHVTGLPFGDVQNYHGAWEIREGIAHRFDPAYDPVARAMFQPPAPPMPPPLLPPDPYPSSPVPPVAGTPVWSAVETPPPIVATPSPPAYRTPAPLPAAPRLPRPTRDYEELSFPLPDATQPTSSSPVIFFAVYLVITFAVSLALFAMIGTFANIERSHWLSTALWIGAGSSLTLSLIAFLPAERNAFRWSPIVLSICLHLAFYTVAAFVIPKAPLRYESGDMPDDKPCTAASCEVDHGFYWKLENVHATFTVNNSAYDVFHSRIGVFPLCDLSIMWTISVNGHPWKSGAIPNPGGESSQYVDIDLPLENVTAVEFTAAGQRGSTTGVCYPEIYWNIRH